MRCLPLVVLVVANAWAQSGPRVQFSQTTESLRGVSAVSRQVAWASGTHGTYLRTLDGGRTWMPAQVPDAGALDFRGVVAFSSRRSVSHVRRAGRAVADLPHQRRWAALAAAVHQHESQGLFRFHGVLGCDAWNGGGRSHPRRVWETQVRSSSDRRWAELAACCHRRSYPMRWKARALSPPRIRASRSFGQPPIPMSGSLPGARRHAFSTLPIADDSWEVFDTPMVHGADSAGNLFDRVP